MSEKTNVEKAKDHLRRNWKRYALGAGTAAALGAGYHQRDRLKGAGKTAKDFVLGKKVITAGDRPNTTATEMSKIDVRKNAPFKEPEKS